jgi:hypothetical protein
MVATEFDRPPLDFHAHGAGIVVDLRDMGQDLCVDFGANGLGKVL